MKRHERDLVVEALEGYISMLRGFQVSIHATRAELLEKANECHALALKLKYPKKKETRTVRIVPTEGGEQTKGWVRVIKAQPRQALST